MKKPLQDRLSALCEINNRFAHYIDSDPILKHDFAELMDGTHLDEAIALQHHRNIISHLIAESEEAIEDAQRISDESPICLPDNSDAGGRASQKREMIQALDDYKDCYLGSDGKLRKLH